MTNGTRPHTDAEWRTAVGTGLLRLGVGAALVRFRTTVSALAGADDDSVVPTVVAVLGVRDMTLGVMALAATRPGGDPAKQVKLQAAADAVDSTLVAAGARAGLIGTPQAIGMVGVAWVSAALEWATARRIGTAAGRF